MQSTPNTASAIRPKIGRPSFVDVPAPVRARTRKRRYRLLEEEKPTNRRDVRLFAVSLGMITAMTLVLSFYITPSLNASAVTPTFPSLAPAAGAEMVEDGGERLVGALVRLPERETAEITSSRLMEDGTRESIDSSDRKRLLSILRKD